MVHNLSFRLALVAKQRGGAEEVPPDNIARIVLYDGMVKAESEYGFAGLTESELFDRVIHRLRVFVPRELHNQGEHQYVAAKIKACLDAGVLQVHSRRDGLLILGPKAPRIRYPDATIHDYTAGFEAARERLEADERRLRQAGFDVRDLVGSPANKKKSDRFKALVRSMEEHGFQGFPIIVGASGDIDGAARRAAAAETGVVLKSHNTMDLPRHRDTPLQRALLVLDVNAHRLGNDEVAKVHAAIAERTGRPWSAIETDLECTREWRRAKPKEYPAILEVELVRYRDHEEPKVQVTPDGTLVALRSLTREAGIPEWGRDDLEPHVPFEEARAKFRGGGRKAIFVRVADAIDGIEEMKDARDQKGLRTDPAWEDARQWLLSLAAGRSATTETPEQPALSGMEPPGDE